MTRAQLWHAILQDINHTVHDDLISHAFEGSDHALTALEELEVLATAGKPIMDRVGGVAKPLLDEIAQEVRTGFNAFLDKIAADFPLEGFGPFGVQTES